MDLIQDLQNAKREAERNGVDIEIRTFGHFTILLNNTPVHFSRKASLDVMAYLVHNRGAVVNKEHIVDEVLNIDHYDKKVQNRIHVILVSMKRDLKRYGIDHILYVNSNEYAVLTDCFHCDYYEFLEQGVESLKDDPSSYLTDYDWALNTRSFLENRYLNIYWK